MSCQENLKTQAEIKSVNQGNKPVEVSKMQCQKDCERCKEKKERSKPAMLKYPIATMAFLMSNFIVASAQTVTPAENALGSGTFSNPMLPIYLVGTLVSIVIILTLVVTILLYRVVRLLTRKAEEERAARSGVAYLPEPSWWTKLWENANALVPLESEKSIELDHNYDGIKELDNHLPPWWKGLFYGSIVFAVVYMALYHLSDTLPLAEEEYEIEIAQAQERARILKASQPVEAIDESTLTYSPDAALTTDGKRVFTMNNCGSCHRSDGGGNAIGPNLTDNYWLHGGEIREVFSTIRKGVVEKGMPAWGKVMSPKDVRNVAFYIVSLQGTNPPGAKSPQGKEYQQKPAVSSIDTLKVQSAAKK